MAIDLRFLRNDNTPWGFRLTGGADFDVPLTVIKVKEGSLAAEAGLQVDDIIVRINNIPTAGLTHVEAHDLILDAGNDFVIAIRRGEEQTYTNREDDNYIKINKENILRNLRNIELQNSLSSTGKLNGETPDERIAEVISGQSELLPEQNILGVNFNNVDLSNSKVLETFKEGQSRTSERKWSTFLQKPKGPKPVPKNKGPQPPKYPPYNPLKLPKKKKDELQPVEPKTETTELSSLEEKPEVPNTSHIETNTVASDNRETDFEELGSFSTVEDIEEQKGQEEYQDLNSSEEEREQEVMSEEFSRSENDRAEAAEPLNVTPSLEEQLAHVQKQLLALSHLPTSIQKTIEAVTQELARIASAANQSLSQRAESSLDEQQEINDEELAERAAEESAEEELAFDHSEGESEEHEAPNKFIEDVYEDEKRSEDDFSEDESYNENPQEDAQPRELSEEEKEQIRREQQRIEKQQKEEGQLKESYQRRIEQRPTRALAPLQRPIILPGGRKWAQPDDAALSKRPGRMTDEKIAETIETYSEVITGKLKGINFLKYTPPPRNLDYLQNSEVFRLLHEMDKPPRRGIAARPEIIPAVQDIYKNVTN